MKSQRRHDLQQNTLRLELARGYEFLRARGNYIAWGALAVAVVVFAAVWLVNRSRAEAQSVQAQYTRLASVPPGSPERLADLKALATKDSHPYWAALAGNEVGVDYLMQLTARWSQLSEADRKSLADQARTSFQDVIDRFPKQDLAVAKAHLGLAKLDETMGDLKAAADEYQTIRQIPGLDGQPVVAISAESLSRLEQLQGMGTVRMATTAPATQPDQGSASQPATATAPAGAIVAPDAATQPTAASKAAASTRPDRP